MQRTTPREPVEIAPLGPVGPVRDCLGDHRWSWTLRMRECRRCGLVERDASPEDLQALAQALDP